LLQQQAAPEIAEFNTKIFKDTSRDSLMDMYTTEQQENLKNITDRFDQFQPNQELYRYFNSLGLTNVPTGLGTDNPQERQRANDLYYSMSMPERMQAMVNAYTNAADQRGYYSTSESRRRSRDLATSLQNEYNKEVSEQKKVGIKDYLKSLYGINSPQGGQV
jgi:hypothetical protein